MNRFHRLLGMVFAIPCVCMLLLSGCGKNTQEFVAPTEPKIIYQGQEYVFRKDLTTLLVLGLDKYERPEEESGYTNHLQSDFLILLVLDEKANTMEVLHLNRDTMTEIRRLGVGGGVAGKFQGQLALAHTYGSGGSDSCLNAVKAVSKLLGGVKIDHYMTLTMDAVAVINDMVGGVQVTVLDDMTSVDPVLEQGKEILLKGDLALAYVRSRYGLDDSSNLRRMERQRQYLTAFYQKIMEKDAESENFLENALLKVSDSFSSDCTANQLDQLAEKMKVCTLAPIRALEGEAVVGEEYMEFYPDQEALDQLVIELFCELKD